MNEWSELPMINSQESINQLGDFDLGFIWKNERKKEAKKKREREERRGGHNVTRPEGCWDLLVSMWGGRARVDRVLQASRRPAMVWLLHSLWCTMRERERDFCLFVYRDDVEENMRRGEQGGLTGRIKGHPPLFSSCPEDGGWVGQLRRQKLEISVHLSAVSSHLAVSQVASRAIPPPPLLATTLLTTLLISLFCQQQQHSTWSLQRLCMCVSVVFNFVFNSKLQQSISSNE